MSSAPKIKTEPVVKLESIVVDHDDDDDVDDKNDRDSASTTNAQPNVKEERQTTQNDSVPMAEDHQREFGDMGDLFTNENPDAPIKDLSEKWKLVPAFLKLHGLVRQHIDSFDYFVNVEIKQILKANNRVTSDADPSFFFEYRDVWIGEPCVEEELVVNHITPHQCRLRDMTYAAPIFVSVDYVRGRELVKRNGIQIGRMPIMLRSSKCILSGLSDAALASANECPRDPGGYFVVRGTEKVLLIQEQLSKNRIIIERDFKGTLVASVTSSANNFKSRCQVLVNKHGHVCVRHNNFAEEMNAAIVLMAMGIPTTAAIASLVGTDLVDEFQPTLTECTALNVHTELDALNYIGGRLRQPAHWRTRRRRPEEARDILIHVVLGHVPAPRFDLRDKAAYIALMVRRLLLASSDDLRIDDRDYYGNKRLELAGQLLALLFEDLFKRFNSDFKRAIDKSLEKHYRVEQFDAIKLMRSDMITHGLTHAISTGNWNLKRFKMERAGISAVLSRLSFIASLGMMTRITSQFEKTRKISGPRALQGSQWGMLCPSDTPEGESCGLVKNLALLTHVTTGDDEVPLRRLCFNLGVEELQRAGLASSAASDAHIVLLNGAILGVHRHPRRLARALRRMRRAGVVGEFVSVHVDERQRAVLIAADGGRLCRPLLICRRGRPLLTPAHLKSIANGESNFGDLLLAGVVEFIDVNEENNCLIAVRETNLKPTTTHLEIEPFTLLGVVAGLIPYPHHNQSPRNTYQCAMGKQAMGAIGQNQRQRIDTVLYLLVYPQRPMCATRTINLIGYNELPAGQNASIFVMSYSGYDIEDALVLNRASLDRGFGRCALMRKQVANAKKYPNQTSDRFEYSLTTRTAPEQLHALGRDGIAEPGSRLAYGDVYVNKKVPENTVEAVRDDPTRVPMKDVETTFRGAQPVMVDQVVLTSSEDEHWLVKLLTRDTRRPELGDKFSSRHGQKGVVGVIVPQTDMPFAGNGVYPDLIMNPHGFPSRMTVGKMIELIAGKAGVLHGGFRHGTAFGGDKVADIGADLIRAGYSYSGKDVLTCGTTGDVLPSYVFAGPVYYQKLKHMVIDKMHARARGPRAVLTRQPTEGRSRDGGLRLGEMERDCLIAYGASLLLLERLMISRFITLIRSFV